MCFSTVFLPHTIMRATWHGHISHELLYIRILHMQCEYVYCAVHIAYPRVSGGGAQQPRYFVHDIAYEIRMVLKQDAQSKTSR